MNESPLKPVGDGYELPVVGSALDRCCVSRGKVELMFDHRELTPVLSIWHAFRVTRWRQEWRLDPAEPESLYPILALVGVVPVAAVASARGAAELLFPEGTLRVEPGTNPGFAWEFGRGDGVLVRGSGGARLTVESWPPRRGTRVQRRK